MLLSRHRPGPALPESGSAVAIGAFDGVHPGHQTLLGKLVERARGRGLASAVVCFEPLPRQYFARQPLLRLTPFRDRYERIAACGVDHMLQLRFDRELAALSPEEFVAEVLVQRLRAREVWVGPDFRFGHQRRGDLTLLEELGRDAGFTVSQIDTCEIDGERISSTRVRSALAMSDFDAAQRLLGRRYGYSGRVVRGKQLGRQLGFPTANLRWPQDSLGLHGIFAVRVDGAGLQAHPGVASLGYRPVVHGKELLLEVHLFRFDGDLYGQRLRVDFIAKQRDEWHFPDLDTLVQQIRRDADEALRRLGETST